MRTRIMRFLPALALLVATSAFATGKGTFEVDRPTTVGDHQLAPGEYQARWEGSGPDVQVSIFFNRKLVTTVPGKLVQVDRGPSSTEVAFRHQEDGTWSLEEVDFGGKKYELHFAGDAAPSASGSQASNQ